MKIPYSKLISKRPILVSTFGPIYTPTWDEIDSIGYEVYQGFISILMLTDEMLDKLHPELKILERIPEKNRVKLTVFDLIAIHDDTQEMCSKALSFFCKKPAVFDKKQHCFVLGTKKEKNFSYVTRENHDVLFDFILQLNFIRSSPDKELKFKNKAAKRIYDKIQAAKKEQKQTNDKSMELPNLVSAICARHPSINFLNVGNLTVGQIYDTFIQMGKNHQFDASVMRWAAYGTEPFDFSLWYKSTRQ
jgi:hypothetical protein